MVLGFGGGEVIINQVVEREGAVEAIQNGREEGIWSLVL